MTAAYAQQLIDSTILDDNGIPKFVDYIDLLSVQAGIEQNYDTMDPFFANSKETKGTMILSA